MAVKELLLNTLEELGDEEFRKFKWCLQQPDILEGSSAIPKSHLDKADRQETVDKMVQNHNQGSVEVMKTMLKKINRNDLVEKLSIISTGAQDVVQQPKCLQTIRRDQTRLQSNLQSSFRCVQEGWTLKKDEKGLDDVYAELHVTIGEDTHISRQPWQMDLTSGTPAEPGISHILTHPSGKKNVRTVLTTGVAGIGKTFLVHKFVLDWAEKRDSEDVDLVFPLTFASLNALRGEPCGFAELIHRCVPETVHMQQEVLNNIFTTLQTSGNSNFDRSEYKVLFVLDGLDQSRLQLDFTAKEKLAIDVTESTSVDVLLTNLIRGNLLPSARLWITTQPAAANQIPPECVDMVTEVRGFTDPQKEQYFRKRFRDEERASRIISHLKTSQSLHIMCHIPVVCWITATVLKDLLETRGGGAAAQDPD
ncbi:NACHT, LRR and PYD domains-containing protein 3-like [Mastacembelus armatus]|uniref:NACHT, LRR and PYD domains-containing protein 3-like n=1 Tax=Mastacembelus armatus TaxID=205130 RepID=UPI000E45C7B9|nr:NACHT, LRR and PYD domains-containing protein 3-like [Mastacembelus armatus]